MIFSVSTNSVVHHVFLNGFHLKCARSKDIAGFRAKSEQLARRVSSTTIEQLKGRERGELSRSAIVNMDRPAPLFVRRMFGHKDRTVS